MNMYSKVQEMMIDANYLDCNLHYPQEVAKIYPHYEFLSQIVFCRCIHYVYVCVYIMQGNSNYVQRTERCGCPKQHYIKLFLSTLFLAGFLPTNKLWLFFNTSHVWR